MARVEIGEVVWKSAPALTVVADASVQVNHRSGGAATIYQAETGVATHPNPLSTDSAGRIEGWLETGSYDLVVSGSGFTTYTQRFEAVPGALVLSVESGRPWKDIREFASGIDLTGATDNSDEVQDAIDAAVAADYGIWSPAGTLKAGSVTLRSGLSMKGAPGFATRLVLPALDYVGGVFGTGTAGVSCDDVVLEDIYLDGQQQLRSVSCGNALLKAYKAKRWTLRRVKIANGTSYGFGYQGYPGEADANKQDIPLDLLMEQCYVRDNGYIGGTVDAPRSGTPNSSDNLDIKSAERAVLNKVYSAFSSDPCFDIRARRADLIGCVAEGGGGAGFELDSHRPNAGAGWADNDSYITVNGGKARGNGGSGMVASSTTGESDTHLDLIGFQSTDNAGSGFANNAPTAGGEIYLSVLGGKYTDNDVDGLAPNAIKHFTINGASVKGNGGDGIDCTNQDGGAIVGNIVRSNTGTGIKSTGTSDKLAVAYNDVRNNGAAFSLVGQKNRLRDNVQDDTAPTVASTADMTLPTDRGKTNGLVIVTGTATIGDIPRGYIGEVVRLWFQGALTVSHNNSSILLNGDANKSAAANDVLELVCVNVNFWREVAA